MTSADVSLDTHAIRKGRHYSHLATDVDAWNRTVFRRKGEWFRVSAVGILKSEGLSIWGCSSCLGEKPPRECCLEAVDPEQGSGFIPQREGNRLADCPPLYSRNGNASPDVAP
jgi:hypothetical protein